MNYQSAFLYVHHCQSEYSLKEVEMYNMNIVIQLPISMYIASTHPLGHKSLLKVLTIDSVAFDRTAGNTENQSCY